MKFLIAPDSFKGSLTAIEFCRIAAQQIRKIYSDAQITQMPMADGGEGTIDTILANVKGRLYSQAVQNPLADIITAHYAVLDAQQTAVIEMAQASGLPLLTIDQQNPMFTSSYGTGELILAALDRGCRRFIIGLGGSATNDGGTGLLQALGIRFLDHNNKELDACGQVLEYIHSIDHSGFDSRIKDCEFIIAGDVSNPLLGDSGATAVFATQKGADNIMLLHLEAGMQNFVNKTAELYTTAHSTADKAGAGAAGGLGFALIAYCQASMHSGFELLADMTELDKLLENEQSRPDLIISGEGCFDQQSMDGKLVGHLCQRAEHYQIPLMIVCGQHKKGVIVSNNTRIYSLHNETLPVEYCIKNSAQLLTLLLKKLITDDSFKG